MRLPAPDAFCTVNNECCVQFPSFCGITIFLRFVLQQRYIVYYVFDDFLLLWHSQLVARSVSTIRNNTWIESFQVHTQRLRQGQIQNENAGSKSFWHGSDIWSVHFAHQYLYMCTNMWIKKARLPSWQTVKWSSGVTPEVNPRNPVHAGKTQGRHHQKSSIGVSVAGSM